MSVVKRLVSALCAFTFSGAYDVFALPKVNFDLLGILEGLASKGEGGSASVKSSTTKLKSGKGKKGKGDKKSTGKGKKKKEPLRSIGWNDVLNLLSALKFPYTTAISMLKKHGAKWGGVAFGGIAIEKILEFPFNQIVYPAYLEYRYLGYQVLAKAFNLGGEKADGVLKIVGQVDSIGRGFNNFVKYFVENFLENSNNSPKNLDSFPVCYDNTVFIFYVLFFHYQSGKYKDKDVITRFCDASKRGLIPFKSKRSSCRFAKGACKDNEASMTNINHGLKDASKKNSWFEFGFLGYDAPVKEAYNIKMLENYLVRALTDDTQESKTFKKRFDDLNDKGTAKAVTIEAKGENKYWDVRCDGDKLYFVSEKAKVSEKAGTLTVVFTIPSGNEKTSGYDLLDIQFKEKNA